MLPSDVAASHWYSLCHLQKHSTLLLFPVPVQPLQPAETPVRNVDDCIWISPEEPPNGINKVSNRLQWLNVTCGSLAPKWEKDEPISFCWHHCWFHSHVTKSLVSRGEYCGVGEGQKSTMKQTNEWWMVTHDSPQHKNNNNHLTFNTGFISLFFF